jgi:hypothetical protein
MMKIVISAALAATVCTSESAAQSLVQRSDWQAKSFETYLPSPAHPGPLLEIDVRTKPRKLDLPLGWFANAAPSIWYPMSPEMLVASQHLSGLRRM